MDNRSLEFVSISSCINPSFWSKLSEIKLDVDKLNETKHSIWGYFSNINNKSNIPILEVNSTSFNENFESQNIYIPFNGQVWNVNTLEQFKECDKTDIINNVGQEILNSIINGKALEQPSILNQFFILSFSDLKKFNFYYWFAFPVPHNLRIDHSSVKNISEVLTTEQLNDFWNKYCALDSNQKPFFLMNLDKDSVNVFQLKAKLHHLKENNYSDYYFVYYDLSLVEKPGSTLRNYVTLLLYHCPFLQGKSAKFLCLRLKRDKNSIPTFANSILLTLILPVCEPSIQEKINTDPRNRWVGWEKNERGKMGPRLSNMRKFMDPKELAESSVDLNLKLMKWRLLSNINLEIIKVTKFLLLGSGTLGCSVARILLGWGARNISFVDNSTVSYSNPVRQSLFTFEDSKSGKPKSVAAADNLRNIFPGVKANAFQLTIPMPGHSIGESMLEQVKSDVDTLVKLVEEHDIIFLLMDSRESRWLPTLLGTYFNKTVINAALGFDSYLVMRHGVKVDLEEFNVRQHRKGFKSLKGNYLGCYFCNDVTAPGDSMKDRTLDQQCTVTRPGVSAIAGALSAELAISILQHKEGAKAPAFFQVGSVQNISKEIDNQCVLGLIPHSIRGYLSSFSQVLPATERYQQCVACSENVQNSYKTDGFNFLLKVFQNSKYLEDITGLSDLKKEAEDIGVWEFSDEEEIDCVSLDKEAEESMEYNRSQGDILIDSSHVLEKDSGSMEQCQDSQSNTFGTADSEIESKSDLAGSPTGDSHANMPGMIEEDLSSFVSTSANDVFNKMTEEMFQRLLDKINAAKSVGDVLELGTLDLTNVVSRHTESHDLMTILERKNIVSSTESLMVEYEELNERKRNEKKSVISDENRKNIEISNSSTISLESSFPSTVSTLVGAPIPKHSNMLEQSSTSKYTSSPVSVDQFSEKNLPKELIPIFKKQNILNRNSNASRNGKSEVDTSEQSKKTIMSTSSSYSSEKKSLRKYDTTAVVPPVLTTLKSKVSMLTSDSNEIIENKNRAAFINKIETIAKEIKKSVFGIVNFKSKLKSFVNSEFSTDMTKIESGNRTHKLMKQEKSERDDIMITLLNSRKVISSESSFLDGSSIEGIDIDDSVIFLSKPQKFCSSSSLSSSGNFGMNESMYYLAETDSDKTIKGSV